MAGLVDQHVQEILHDCAHLVEANATDGFPPVLFDFGDPVAGVVQRLTAATSRKNQLGPAVNQIGPALQVAEPLQVTDEFRGGGQTQLRTVGQLGEPNPVDPNVSEDVQVWFA